MSIQVKSFDDKELYEAIKKSPKIVQEYIIAQRHALDGYKSTLGEAMNKIFKLSHKTTRESTK